MRTQKEEEVREGNTEEFPPRGERILQGSLSGLD